MSDNSYFIKNSIESLRMIEAPRLQKSILENVVAVVAVNKASITSEEWTSLCALASRPHLRPALLSLADAVAAKTDEANRNIRPLTELTKAMLEQGRPREAARIMDRVTGILAANPERTQYEGLTVGIYEQIATRPETVGRGARSLEKNLTKAFCAAATSRPVAKALDRMKSAYENALVTVQRAKTATLIGAPTPEKP